MDDEARKQQRSSDLEALRQHAQQPQFQQAASLQQQVQWGQAIAPNAMYNSLPQNSRDATSNALTSQYFNPQLQNPSMNHSIYPNGNPMGYGQQNTMYSPKPAQSQQLYLPGAQPQNSVYSMATGFGMGQNINQHNFVGHASNYARPPPPPAPGPVPQPSSNQLPIGMYTNQRTAPSTPTRNGSYGNMNRQVPQNGHAHQNGQQQRQMRSYGQAPSVDPTEVAFQSFKLSFPQENPQILAFAWRSSQGHYANAEKNLKDNNWRLYAENQLRSHQRQMLMQQQHQLQQIPSGSGRVEHVVQAGKQERAAIKQRGVQSAIYAKRNNLVGNGQPSMMVSPPSAKRQQAPSSPFVPPPRKKARKVVMSDSESEFNSDDDDEDVKPSKHSAAAQATAELKALEFFNRAQPAALQELTGCNADQSNEIISRRPFTTVQDLEARLSQGRKKSGPAGISGRIFEDCVTIFEGYGQVDDILLDCEELGTELRAVFDSWSPQKGNVEDPDDGAVNLTSMQFTPEVARYEKNYIMKQPELVSKDVSLKDYQMLGVNWLNLLYSRETSCILADEMGLGKTIQVISFFAHLKHLGNFGPHLIIVPASTLENWCREFARFAPSINVQTYYASKSERAELRDSLNSSMRHITKAEEGWEVLITTYNSAAGGDEHDRRFFRKIAWDTTVFDEGHVLKNFQSQRYTNLIRYGSKWRLLLTGTPLQNNLQELVSLMNFVHPERFPGDTLESLRAIFKVKGDTKVSLLASERISRAKRMMTPFVLRRRKDQVLKDLPSKLERIEWCELTTLQQKLYTDALQRSRKTVMDDDEEAKPVKGRKNAKSKEKQYQENSSNVLMNLRKAAGHPMLFRTRFTDKKLTDITKLLLKEEDFIKRKAVAQYVKEDMEVMTDAELQVFMSTYKATEPFLLDKNCYEDAGKVITLMKLVNEYIEAKRKILIFSQFTQILDILRIVLKEHDIGHLMLTGTTPVDARQSLVDEFTEDDTLPVFLLSTKAGGMGINLTAASVVILFDQDFNPHNDRQAQDRAYRIGQTRDVDIIKLITKGTIEEDMLRLGETKLALDSAVAGDTEEDSKQESAVEQDAKRSLMRSLRSKFEESQQV